MKNIEPTMLRNRLLMVFFAMAGGMLVPSLLLLFRADSGCGPFLIPPEAVIMLLAGSGLSFWVYRKYVMSLIPVIHHLHGSVNRVSCESCETAIELERVQRRFHSRQEALLSALPPPMDLLASTEHNPEADAKKLEETMMDSFETVSDANGGLAALIVSMEDISRGIRDTSSIVSTIDKIAFQTRLLALNASIEAAHAGRKGDGFSIVAEEVRSLAARASDAARQTGELIQDAVHRAAEGEALASKTLDDFASVTRLILEMQNALDGFRENSEIQQRHVGQIVRAVKHFEENALPLTSPGDVFQEKGTASVHIPADINGTLHPLPA